jgi:Xaa-Pro aminopeptidase
MLLRQRFTKSDDERKLLKKAAELNDGAYKEVLKKLRPGMKEYEVAGIIEGFHRGHGADKTFNLVFSGPFPASKEGIPFQGLPWCPGQRAIEKGDCVHMEMTNAYGGYWNQLVRIISVGVENSALLEKHKGWDKNSRCSQHHGRDFKRVRLYINCASGPLCGIRPDRGQSGSRE